MSHLSALRARELLDYEPSTNLRPASTSENQANSVRPKKRTRTPKGVTIHTQTGRFQAPIKINGRSIYLGLHGTAEAAHAAYANAAQHHFGEYARLS